MPVYLARAVGTNAIKIGWCKGAPSKRIRDLQTGSHQTLELVGWKDGDVKEEHRLHDLFKPFHMRGEWFRMCPAIAREIVMGDPVFAALAALEPKLAHLAERLGEVECDGPTFCANAAWYGWDERFGVKNGLSDLVGWYRKGPPEELKTGEAYSRVYECLYKLLPPCRGCGCL